MSDIWNFLRDGRRYVYHYTRAEKLICILRSRELRFRKFADVDDPYEYKNWDFSYRDTGADFDPALDKKLNDAIKHCWRVGCFSSDHDNAVMKSIYEPGLETIKRAHWRGHSLPAMWAAYADDHRGACLVFDRSKLDMSVRDSAHGSVVIAKPVAYENHQPVPDFSKDQALIFSLAAVPLIGLDTAIDQHTDRHQDSLFFLKSLNWGWQQEFRWIVRNDRADTHHVPIGDALVAIILGARFTCVDQLIEFCGLAEGWDKFVCCTMEWQNGAPLPPHPVTPDLIRARLAIGT